jgi:DnaJ-class molecular chaperone
MLGFTPLKMYLYYINWLTSGYTAYFGSPRKQINKENVRDIYNEAFQVLQINPTDDITEIKIAYRKLALTYHPDVYNGSDDMFKQIQIAYEILINKKTYPNG